jgi:hypothetical protein
MIGTYGNLKADDPDYIVWKTSGSELGFTRFRKRMHGMLRSDQCKWLLADEEFPDKTFRQLCNFTHSRPSSSDGALWESNGPGPKPGTTGAASAALRFSRAPGLRRAACGAPAAGDPASRVPSAAGRASDAPTAYCAQRPAIRPGLLQGPLPGARQVSRRSRPRRPKSRMARLGQRTHRISCIVAIIIVLSFFDVKVSRSFFGR